MAYFIKWYLIYTSGFIALAILDDWFNGVPFEIKPRLWQCAAAGLLMALLACWHPDAII